MNTLTRTKNTKTSKSASIQPVVQHLNEKLVALKNSSDLVLHTNRLVAFNLITVSPALHG